MSKPKLRPRRWPKIVLLLVGPYTLMQVMASAVTTPIPERQFIAWMAHGVIALCCLTAVLMDEYFRRKQGPVS